MRKWLIAVLCIIALAACGGDDSSSTVGSNPFTPGGDIEDPIDPGDPRLARMGLAASQYTVRTDNSDTATLTVTALDENNAALAGVPLSLQASAGLLNTTKVTTGDEGTTEFTFRAGPERTNQVATVTVTSGEMTQTVPILIQGTEVSFFSAKSSVLLDDVQGSALSGRIVDAGGNPVVGQELVLSSSDGNTISAITQGGLPDSGPNITVNSDTNGEFQATFIGRNLGRDNVTLESCGVRKNLEITVRDSNFGFIQPENEASVPVGESIQIVAQWEDAAGPRSGEVLLFSADSGTFLGDTATTDPEGRASITYQANVAAPALLRVTSATGEEDSLRLNVLAVNPERLDLQAFPTAIAPSIGTVSSTSTITAAVRDENNNPVEGVWVDFHLLSGPGGGEFISPMTARSDALGIAKTTFTAGGITSAQNGVKIQATADGFTDEVSLSIGQQAARIVIGTTNKLEIISIDGNEVAFGMPVTFLVTDNNGNPIPEQKVDLGVYPTRLFTGYWDKIRVDLTPENPDDDKFEEKWQRFETGSFPNEDLNRNGILDPGEDLDDSGILDPGNIASIPREVMTNENGLASCKVIYAKSYGSWAMVEISAFTTVSGSEAKAATEEYLSWPADDKGEPLLPVMNSPFGF